MLPRMIPTRLSSARCDGTSHSTKIFGLGQLGFAGHGKRSLRHQERHAMRGHRSMELHE